MSGVNDLRPSIVEVAAGTCSPSFFFRGGYCEGAPPFHSWLCWRNPSWETELELWIINVSEPEQGTQARGEY